MKVAIVRQRYSPYGGAERFVARALPALERAGMDVTLIARKQQGWGARRFLRVDPFHAGNLWRDWSFARAARKAWRREHFDVVQSHERIPGCDVYRAGDGVHRRWLELRRAAAGPLERLSIALNPYHTYVCKAEKQMLEHPRLRAVICNSKMVRDEIQRGFRIAPDKLHVIYNGIDLEQFHPKHRERLRGAARAEIGCSAHDTVFLFVGSGFSRKGLDAAIAAVSQGPYWLVVVGRDKYKHPVGERVRFLGVREDVRPYYAAAECFVLPSRYDPFPNTVLEAMAMGLPAIVSSRCGAAEVIEPGVNGWVCRPNDAQGIARLMQAADRAVAAGRMGGAARATAERFGIDAMAKQLVDLYSSLRR
ncbi:MAG TPA: glycosyltransferase family 4 protein [Burkholderiales bacterium]|nr:glycosyltransferase family 4 protein [Burkholderiales bacterium]